MGMGKTKQQHHNKPSPDHAAKEQQAFVLINQGKLQEAELIYRELISAGTNNHIVYGNLAVICGKEERFDEMIDLLGKSLQLNKNYPNAHNFLGVALKAQGNLLAAIASFRKALKLNPNYPEAHNNLGATLAEQGDLKAAIASYNNALKFNPNYPEAFNNLGSAHQEEGQFTAAIASYNKALKLNPNYPEAYYNLGNSQLHQGEVKAAITAYTTALQLRPNYPEALQSMGAALAEEGDLKAAIAAYNQAIQINPLYAEAHNSLGIALHEQGELNEAIASYNIALSLKSNYPEAHNNLSMAELLLGDYKAGLERYEYRSKCKQNDGILVANPPCEQWNGNELAEESQLLLIAEGGVGDTLQFMRYAHALRHQGISVSLCAQRKLHTLIQVSGIDPSPLTPEQGNQISTGKWIPLPSVTHHLAVSSDNPIITKPYVKTTDELNAMWRGILAAEKQPIIGINWQGNPEPEKTGFRGRSFPLETFAPIIQQTNASLLSLQKGFGSEQLETCSFKDRFISSQPQVNETWDFLETAAIIANCDLIITSDTSVAHLAGAMGKTTWLLLKKIPDWRWGLEGDTTFWYPSMRLFRQTEPGNWNEVLQRVVKVLQEEFPATKTKLKQKKNSGAETKNKSNTTAQTISAITVPISLGELIDKITILQIKTQQVQGTALKNVEKELAALQASLDGLDVQVDSSFIQRLMEVNADLWAIEDDIRDKERNKDFGEGFIRLARSVYQQNDRRAAIKKEINLTYDSDLAEEKSYQEY